MKQPASHTTKVPECMTKTLVPGREIIIPCLCEPFVCNRALQYRATGCAPVAQPDVRRLVSLPLRHAQLSSVCTFVRSFFHCFQMYILIRLWFHVRHVEIADPAPDLDFHVLHDLSSLPALISTR